MGAKPGHGCSCRMCVHRYPALPAHSLTHRLTGWGEGKVLPVFVGWSFGVHHSERTGHPLVCCPLLFFSSSFLHPFGLLVEISRVVKTNISPAYCLLEFCQYIWVQNIVVKYGQKPYTHTQTHWLTGRGIPSPYPPGD